MSIQQTINKIDAEIATRKTDSFGIKVGLQLHRDLIQAGKVKKGTFTLLGTGAFPMELSAYDGRYVLDEDWNIGPNDFVVGQDPV